jgi:hypothetical protein
MDSVMPTLDDRIRAARKELADLQSADHPAVIEQKRQDYLEALQRERGFTLHHYSAAVKRGDAHERIPSPLVRGEFIEGELSGTEAAARYKRQLADIDAEIARVTEAG